VAGPNFTNHTDAELAAHAESGFGGQGAIVEALRRHRQATNNLDAKMWWLGVVGVVVAVVGVILAAVQVWVALITYWNH
jgi:hypothetical protein